MRQPFRRPCSNLLLCVYLLAIGIFIACNLIALVIIQQYMKNKSESFENIISKYIQNKNRPEKLEFKKTSESIGFIISDLIKDIPFHYNQSNFRTDAKQKYIIHDSVAIGDAWTDVKSLGQVTLATQSSVDRLYLLKDLAEAWRGPISAAIFVPEVDFYIAKIYIAYLRKCSQLIRNNVTFHFLYPRDMELQPKFIHNKHAVLSCTKNVDTLTSLIEYRSSSFKRWWQKVLYPQNHLRNVANAGCITPYHFVTDIDIIPVSGLVKNLNKFLNYEQTQTCKNCIYIVPTYEMPENLPVPRNKVKLIERVHQNQGRPFYDKISIHNQYATNHSLWESIPDFGYLDAEYEVTNYEFLYAPFYIAKSNVPKYDERFLGLGYSRNTQAYEMYLAGFKFWVLNPAFAVHKGMQEKNSKGKWRQYQNMMNRKQLLTFKTEMMIKYHKTVKK